MKKFSILLLIFATVVLGSHAQKRELTEQEALRGAKDVLAPLPRIFGWADAGNYIYTVSLDGKNQSYKVNAKTLKQEAYEIPKSDATPAHVVEDSGDVYYIDNMGNRKQLTQTKSKELNPLLSPDGKLVGFTRDNDLYSVDIASGKETRITSDGTDLIMNGYLSWVYYEEIIGRSSRYRGFWWSPDSKQIIFFRSDDTLVPMFPIYSSVGQHGFLEQTRYPKAGDSNPKVKIGIAAADGSKTVWADFDQNNDQYFGQPFWTPDGQSMWVQWMNRDQNNLKIYRIDVADGSKKEIYDETNTTWIDWISDMRFVEDGFIIIRDSDGWENLYMHGYDGALKNKITEGQNWGTSVLKIDTKNRKIYYTARSEISTRYDVYVTGLDGKGKKRLTFGDYSFSAPRLSEDNKYLIATYSNVSTPTRIALIDLTKGTHRDIADSKGEMFNAYNMVQPKMVTMTTKDGLVLPAVLTLPLNYDSSKKYPLIVSIYGGPNSGTVMDTWKGFGGNWYAREGVVQVAIDHRGAGHLGKKGLDYLHRSLGKWEVEDYCAWVAWLISNANVDAAKVGINGGSYGGYMSALTVLAAPQYFKYGYAEYSVMDWQLYDSHYTERYMDTPKNNPDGYAAGSVLSYVKNYKGGDGSTMLRVVHGTMDDNVHMQNSIQLVDALQEQKREFEFMLYPGGRHGWGGNKGAHNRTEKHRFWYKHLLNRPMPQILAN